MDIPLAKDLLLFNYAYQVQPFKIKLEDNSFCFVEEIVHLVPQTRLLAFGTWNDKLIFIKIFFHKNHKKHHYERDMDGVNILINNQINTPELYSHQYNKENQFYLIIFERLMDCQTLYQIWHRQADKNDSLAMIKQVVKEIAKQHQCGILQADPNAKNYLIKASHIYTIDGMQIKSFPQELTKEQSLSNLAIFLAHFGLKIKKHAFELLADYSEVRKWNIRVEDKENFMVLLNNRYKNGLMRLKRKVFLKNRNFFPIQNIKISALLDRRYASPELIQFISTINNNLILSNDNLIKTDSTRHIYKIEIGKNTFFIRKLKSQNLFQAAKQWIWPTLAKQAWIKGHHFFYLGYTSAKPVAFIQKNWLSFRNHAYYISVR